MALFDNGFKGNVISGLAIGVGTALLAPIIIPVLASIAKPLAKAAIKGGIAVYDKNKEIIAEAREVIEDLVAESKAELEAQPNVMPGGEKVE
jgi:hypothetical protein